MFSANSIVGWVYIYHHLVAGCGFLVHVVVFPPHLTHSTPSKLLLLCEVFHYLNNFSSFTLWFVLPWSYWCFPGATAQLEKDKCLNAYLGTLTMYYVCVSGNDHVPGWAALPFKVWSYSNIVVQGSNRFVRVDPSLIFVTWHWTLLLQIIYVQMVL